MVEASDLAEPTGVGPEDPKPPCSGTRRKPQPLIPTEGQCENELLSAQKIYPRLAWMVLLEAQVTQRLRQSSSSPPTAVKRRRLLFHQRVQENDQLRS